MSDSEDEGGQEPGRHAFLGINICDQTVMNAEGPDHIPLFGWTKPAQPLFNGAMSITSLSGNGTQPLFAAAQAASAGTGCPCLTVTANGRERIAALAANSASVHATIREAVASAHGIDWSGRAADHYRDRLATVRNSLDAHDGEARSTAQVAQVSRIPWTQGGT